jgi:hypothetical protein
MTYMPRIKQTGESYIDQKGEKQKTRKKTDHKWFETQDPIAYYAEFEKEKVVYQELTQGSSFTYAQIPSVFVSNTAYLITGNELKYLVSILNSAFIEYAFKKYYSIGLGDKGIRWLNQYMQLLPIANPNHQTKMSFHRLVENILVSRHNGKKTQDLESQIDLMVYKLYELSYSEAKLIDPDLDSVLASFGISVQDFERMTVEQLAKVELN